MTWQVFFFFFFSFSTFTVSKVQLTVSSDSNSGWCERVKPLPKSVKWEKNKKKTKQDNTFVLPTCFFFFFKKKKQKKRTNTKSYARGQTHAARNDSHLPFKTDTRVHPIREFEFFILHTCHVNSRLMAGGDRHEIRRPFSRPNSLEKTKHKVDGKIRLMITVFVQHFCLKHTQVCNLFSQSHFVHIKIQAKRRRKTKTKFACSGSAVFLSHNLKWHGSGTHAYTLRTQNPFKEMMAGKFRPKQNYNMI